MTFPERLKNIMQKQGWTNYSLAKELGISKSTITNYLTGVTEPKFKKLSALSKALNVDANWLIGREVQTGEPAPHYKADNNPMGVPEMLDNLKLSYTSMSAEIHRLREKNNVLDKKCNELIQKCSEMDKKIKALSPSKPQKNRNN